MAAAAAAALLAPASAPAADSPFAWRGIVEGPYGRPWDHGQRLRMLRWMPSHGFNAYIHAPKEDPYQRSIWREPYPARELAEFTREIRLARRRGVRWIANVSPALPLLPSAPPPGRAPSRDLCFSCAPDLRALMDKLEPFYRAGARTFMVSFDDVSKVMSHPEDLAAFGLGDEAFGRANGDFLSRLYGAYASRGSRVRLLTVGADYQGTGDTAYLRGLRSTLHREVEVMWTGTNIPSEHWTAADARDYGARIGRKPLVWDNWTNNDTTGNYSSELGTARIFLGPYQRRADVAGAVTGFFFNPMNEADLNTLPLATAGDWMRAPGRFRRRVSWLREITRLAGGSRSRRRLREALRAWAETSYSHRLDPQDAPTFVRLSSAFLTAYRGGGRWPLRHSSLLRELALVEEAPRALQKLPQPAFVAQAQPFLASARQTAGAGRLGAGLLAAERPAVEARRVRGGFTGRAAPPDPDRAAAIRSRYTEQKNESRANPRFTYGWRSGVAFDVPPRTAPANTMQVFFDRVDELDRSWLPLARDAASEVSLTLDGRAVPLGTAGRFRLARSACGGVLVVTDGAGGRTTLRLPRCQRRGAAPRGGRRGGSDRGEGRKAPAFTGQA